MERMLPQYGTGYSPLATSLYRSTPQTVWTHNNLAPIPQRGFSNFRGYTIPTAIVNKMQYTAGVNKGRWNGWNELFGGMPQSGKRDGMYYQDAVRKAYLKKINPQFAGRGALNPNRTIEQDAYTARAKLNAMPRIKKETYANGQFDQATLARRRQEAKLRKTANRQLSQAQQTANRYLDPKAAGQVSEVFNRLQQIKPSRSNVQFKETVR